MASVEWQGRWDTVTPVKPRSFLADLARRWVVLLATALLGVAAGVAISIVTPKSYAATAQVLFTPQVSTTGQDLASAGTYVQSRIVTYRELGESPSVLRLVGRSLGGGRSIKQLRTHTDIEVVPGTTILKITATERTKTQAAKTADTLAGALRLAVSRLENTQRLTKSGRLVGVFGVLIGTGKGDTRVAAPNPPLYVLAGAATGLVVGLAIASALAANRREGRRRSSHPTT